MTTTLAAPPMRDAFAEALIAELDADPRVALVLAEISASLFTDVAGRHPDRVLNLGIREQLLISATAGLALSGLRPVAHTFAPFLVERPFEQVKLDLGHQDLGAVLVSYGASYDMAAAGRTHQSPGDVALLDTLPGWRIHVPGHAAETAPLLHRALAADDRVYLRLSAQSNAAPLMDPEHPDRLRILRDGRRGVVLAIGPLADRVLAAAEGLDVTVAYTPTARPLDGATLRAAALAATRPDVAVVEPYLSGTSSYLVDAALSDTPHRVLSLGVSREAELRHYGTPQDHDQSQALDTPALAAALRTFFRP